MPLPLAAENKNLLLVFVARGLILFF